MLTTPHLLVGTAIGSQVGNPILVATTAAASHSVLDSLPHLGFIVGERRLGAQWDFEDLGRRDLTIVAAAVLLGLGVVTLITAGNPRADLIWLGAFCAFLPDF